MNPEFLGDLSHGRKPHGKTNPLRETLRFEGERPKELPSHLRQDIEIRAFHRLMLN
jgi:hypothetical protein